MKLVKYIVVLFALLAVFNGCYYDNVEELHPDIGKTCIDTVGTVTYNANVKPIITTYCGSTGNAASTCHGTVSSSNLPLVTYADVSLSVDLNLMDAVNQNGNASDMPKGGGKLTDCQIGVLQKWIDTGKLEN